MLEKAHALKGMSGMLGARQICEFSEKIEQASADKEIETININLLKLNNAIEQTGQVILSEVAPDLNKSVTLF